ncbi:MAG: metallopeptidase family protein [Planctomycetota bacterium]
MTRQEFEKLVIAALEDLPKFFRQKMQNVDIVIEDKPSLKQLRLFNKTHQTSQDLILGLYQGVPLSDRTHLYGMVLPDKITIFKKNIEQIYQTPNQIKTVVYHTVQHEIAHHFGISDQRLREMGVY